MRVFPSPYRGGGTLVIGGTELAVRAAAAIAMQTCLGAEPGSRAAPERSAAPTRCS